MALIRNDSHEKMEQSLKLREKILKAEQERINGAKTTGLDETFNMLFQKMAENEVKNC